MRVSSRERIDGRSCLATIVAALAGILWIQPMHVAATSFCRRVDDTEDDDADGMLDRGEFVIERSINHFAQTQTA